MRERDGSPSRAGGCAGGMPARGSSPARAARLDERLSVCNVYMYVCMCVCIVIVCERVHIVFDIYTYTHTKYTHTYT